nr:MAG: terminase large subunit [Caudoviricetes sp.]
MQATAPEVNLSLQPKQGFAFMSKATEILYGGAAGGGKSHLMRALAIIYAMECPGVQIYIFRRNYGDLYLNHMEGGSSFPVMLNPLVEAGQCRILSDNKIRFTNGSTIHLCHLQHKKNLMKYQGAEIHILLMDELTHFLEAEYTFLRGRVRLGQWSPPPEYREKLPFIMNGSNPGSIGHNWVKATFVDYQAHYAITRTAEDEGGMLRQYIPAKLADNQILLKNDPGYEARLSGLGSPELVKAMKTGDWNIVAGGAIDDVWTDRVMVPNFKVPESWRIFRTFDWGSTHPFSYGLWAISNGEEVKLPDGSYFCPQAGSLIRIAEWYGTEKVGSNKGLKMSARKVAEGILERETELYESGWIGKMPYSGVADGQIFNQNEGDDEPTIADKMSDVGVYWERANKSPGSRTNGLQLVRDRFEAVKENEEEPGIYAMHRCNAFRTTLPVLPRDPKKFDDVDTKAEDHVYDDVRYAVLNEIDNSMAGVDVQLRRHG